VTEIVIALVILKTVHFTLLYNMFRWLLINGHNMRESYPSA
jgi:hypothetical protein